MGNRVINNIQNRLNKKGIKFSTYSISNFRNLSSELDLYETELLAQQEELRKNQEYISYEKEKFKNFFYETPIAYVILDKELNIKEFNKEAGKLFSFSSYLRKENYFLSIIHVDDRIMVYDWLKDIKNLNNSSLELFLHTKDGKKVKFKVKGKIQLNDKKQVNYYISLTDISQEDELLKMKNQVEENKTLYLEKFINTLEQITILTNGVILTFANRKLFDFLGYKSFEHFITNHKCICEFFEYDDNFFHLNKIEDQNNWINEIIKLDDEEKLVAMKSRYDEIHIFRVNIQAFHDGLYSVTFNDITKSYAKTKSLEDKVIKDPLTKAYNREFLYSNSNKLIEESKQNEQKLVFALFDIDFFKKINDTYGHDIGDKILIELVELINKVSRVEDTFIRWGGEEFILVLKIRNTNTLKLILEEIRLEIESFKFTKVENLTCSIGASYYNNDKNIDTIIKRADIALYKSKQNGRNQVNIF